MDELKKLKKQQEELRKEQELLMQLYRIINARDSKKKQSENDSMILLMREIVWLSELKENPAIWEKVHDCMEMEPVTVEVEEDASAYKQMTLFGMENAAEKPKKKKRKVSVNMFLEEGCFIKGQREPEMNGVLLRHDKATLMDYLKYMAVDVPQKANLKILAQTLEACLCSDPLRLLPALPESTVKILLGFEKLAEQESVIVNQDNLDDYSILLLWGMLSVQTAEHHGKMCFLMTMPKEVKENVLPVYRQLTDTGLAGKQIASYLDSEQIYTLEEVQRYHAEMFLQMKKILTQYGAVERNAMYEMFRHLVNINCEEDDFVRFMYLFGTFHQLWATGMNQMTKEQYIGLNAEMIEKVFTDGHQKVDRYYEYQSVEELEQSFCEYMDLWNPVQEVLEQWEVPEDEILDYIAECANLVVSGFSLTYVLEEIEKDFDLDQVMDAACMWRQLVIIYQHFPCHLLKGYSRLQAEEEFGVERYYDVFESRSGNKIARAALYELPVELQQQLADTVLLAQQGKFQTVMEQQKGIDRKYLTNPAVNAVLIMNLADAYAHSPAAEKQQWKKETERCVEQWCREAKDSEARELMLCWCEDKGIFLPAGEKKTAASKRIFIGDEEMGSYYWEDFEPEMKPVVKAEKIYPNDPCPCGSGKKYKKCCGR